MDNSYNTILQGIVQNIRISVKGKAFFKNWINTTHWKKQTWLSAILEDPGWLLQIRCQKWQFVRTSVIHCFQQIISGLELVVKSQVEYFHNTQSFVSDDWQFVFSQGKIINQQSYFVNICFVLCQVQFDIFPPVRNQFLY